MFVAASQISNNHMLYRWADNKEFPELFARQVSPDGQWARAVVVDDDNRAGQTKAKVSSAMSTIFYAKDKDTLQKGLKVTSPSSDVRAEGAQLGIFCGAYDFEEAAGWGKNKILALQT